MKIKDLYHYTTGAGLLGMLKDYDAQKEPNLTLWASHYMAMNDPSEYLFGNGILIDAVYRMEEEMGIPAEERISDYISKGKMRQMMEQIQTESALDDNYRPYILSLSTQRDDLHMWTMYARNGNGLALQFSEDLTSMEDKFLTIVECKYADSLNDELYEYIKRQYLEWLPVVKERILKLTSEDDCYRYRGNRMFAPMMVYSMLDRNVSLEIKHAAYKIEGEYRLYLNDEKKDVLFRESQGKIIPYVNAKIPIEFLSQIIVGPTADFECVRETLIMFLRSKGIPFTREQIVQSNVPYRG